MEVRIGIRTGTSEELDEPDGSSGGRARAARSQSRLSLPPPASSRRIKKPRWLPQKLDPAAVSPMRLEPTGHSIGPKSFVGRICDLRWKEPNQARPTILNPLGSSPSSTAAHQQRRSQAAAQESRELSSSPPCPLSPSSGFRVPWSGLPCSPPLLHDSISMDCIAYAPFVAPILLFF